MFKVIKINSTPTKKIIEEAVKVLIKGGLVIYPTETLYGIGVDATNQKAVNKLLTYKTRREGKPLSIAVNSLQMAKEYVEINPTAHNLYYNFLPGPLTVVSSGLGKVAKGVESEIGTLGVRIPKYELILNIIESFGKPITATSANASYKKQPYCIDDILENISTKQKNLIDLIIDANQLEKRDPSTVVDTTLNEEVVLRQGKIKLTKILERITMGPEETQNLGIELLNRYKHHLGYKSIIFAFQGELGVGKTEMTKGLAKALKIDSIINSPTFILEKEYKIKNNLNLYHIDTWRMFDGKELEQLGFFEKVSNNNVFAIEWADKITKVLNNISSEAIIIWIKIEHKSDTTRLITISDYIL